MTNKNYSCASAHVYLFYDGDAEEAFNFYKEVFQRDFSSDGIRRYADMPNDDTEKQLSPEDAQKVMHVELKIAPEFSLMGSDILRAAGQQLDTGNTTHVTLVPRDMEQAENIYSKLSEGGEILVPLEKSFWGTYFAHFRDRWGIYWMIDI